MATVRYYNPAKGTTTVYRLDEHGKPFAGECYTSNSSIKATPAMLYFWWKDDQRHPERLLKEHF